VPAAWPVRTREHVDLWLHSYALILDDTTLVPYFRRGYREQMIALRNQRGVSTLLNTNRSKLLARIAVEPSLATNGQFLPLYFANWDQMRQTIDQFIRHNGNPGASADPNARVYYAILGSAFPSAADRDWLRLFADAAEDERIKFYQVYWIGEQRSHGMLVLRIDSLWKREWRPPLQRFLNNTQQQNGELYLSQPIGGEGRTVHFGKQQNAVAVPLPDSRREEEIVLYVMAHEIAGTVASTALEDNTTPAERRSGGASRYEQAAAVRAGAMLLEKTNPPAIPGYMRYYLQQAGKNPPTDPRAMFVSTFSVPDAVREAIAKQIAVTLGGI
jgi:hypothetical protein